jgi:hypothetical protein
VKSHATSQNLNPGQDTQFSEKGQFFHNEGHYRTNSNIQGYRTRWFPRGPWRRPPAPPQL